jgi:hypothetical protein
MVAIIKKGTNPSSFRLKTGRVITLQPDILTVVTDDNFEELMREYGSFIEPRIISDKNPSGCFIISQRGYGTDNTYASDMNKEVGKIKDASSRIEVKAPAKTKAKKKG